MLRKIIIDIFPFLVDLLINNYYMYYVIYYRSVADFPKFLGIAIETFLNLCDDSESDIRMVADECLNKSIKVSIIIVLLI